MEIWASKCCVLETPVSVVVHDASLILRNLSLDTKVNQGVCSVITTVDLDCKAST